MRTANASRKEPARPASRCETGHGENSSVPLQYALVARNVDGFFKR